MKGFYFSADLLALLRNDAYYGDYMKLDNVLRKFGLGSQNCGSCEPMLQRLVVHILAQHGETLEFLDGAFISPETLVALLKARGLPAPAVLRPANGSGNGTTAIDEARFEELLDTVCRNCGTVTDPLAANFRTPIGRLIFRTFLQTRLGQGINTTPRYVLEHLKEFDSGNILTRVEEDHVTWKTGDGREKLTSLHTIETFVRKFNRELDCLLGH